MNLKFDLTCELPVDRTRAINCIGLEYGKFMSDVVSTADERYEYHENYPEGLLHDKIASMLEEIEENKHIDFPFLFSIGLDREISMLDCDCRYTFLFMDKRHFSKICREYRLDKETRRACFDRDTKMIVIYTGLCTD